VRVLTEAGRRDPHPPERLQRAGADLALGQVRLVLLERLLEVVLDPLERVEARHRLLEDQAELRAAHPAELLRRQPDEVPAAVEHLPV
jgi:hypothetical protein